MQKEFKKHGASIKKGGSVFGVWYSFDTFRTPIGWDRAIKNFIRLLCMFVLIANVKSIVMIIFAIFGVGITKFDYFKNKRKKLEVEFWR